MQRHGRRARIGIALLYALVAATGECAQPGEADRAARLASHGEHAAAAAAW